MPDNTHKFYIVTIFLEDLNDGGPEEGGWYYSSFARLDAPPEHILIDDHVRVFTDPGAADAWCLSLQGMLDDIHNKHRPPITSVASRGSYTALVSEGWQPAVSQLITPRYE